MSKCVLEKNPGLPLQIWDVYYLPSTLGKTLLWSATGGGGLHRLQTFVFAAAKNQRIQIMLGFRAVHLMMPAMTAALRGGGNDEDGSARDAQLVDSRGQEAEASTQKPASEQESNGKKAALADFLLGEGNADLGRRDAAMAFGVVALPLRPHGWHRRCMTSLLSSLSTGGLVLGCAFLFVFRFLQGLIWWNPLFSAESAEFCGTHVGIKSFQGKIDLFPNPTES